jgi:hypothetical protein
MDNKTAKQIVNEALHIAIQKGSFGLVEVTNIVKALDFLNEQPDVEFGEIDHQELSDIRETKLG